MLTELWDRVAQYITENSEISNWKEIRQNYAYYSYMAFLCLTVKDLRDDSGSSTLYDIAGKYGLGEPCLLNYIKKIPGADRFAAEIFDLINGRTITGIDRIYQAYLSRDYHVAGDRVEFAEGKNSRDILGSYYTQENFAYEITKKAIDDYCFDEGKIPNLVRIADLSCGGGTFLASAYKVCKEKNISAVFYGYDVDPIAVLITRARMAKALRGTEYDFHIALGNPLIKPAREEDVVGMFKMAASGRFYNSAMGSSLKENIDIAVGNPPWEKIRFEEKKFLGHYIDAEETGTKEARKRQLELAEETNHAFYKMIETDYEAAKKGIKKDRRFCFSSCGELNTYALFTELCLNMIKDGGLAGLIVKASLVKLPVYSNFFRNILTEKSLYELYMFVNRRKIFNIDSREEFSVIYLHGTKNKGLRIALNANELEDLAGQPKTEISYSLLNKLNPGTGMIPNIKSNEELQFLIRMYSGRRTFGEQYKDCKFGRLVHFTNHSEYIRKEAGGGYAPVYEGKFLELYTAKYATFEGMAEEEKYKGKVSAVPIKNIDGDKYPQSRFFIQSNVWERLKRKFDGEYVIAWRSLTSATNRRTMLATLLPLIPTCQSIQLLQLQTKTEMLRVLAVFNSIIFDSIVRLKMAGLDLTQTIIRQLPMPEEERFKKVILFGNVEATIDSHINSRIYRLYMKDSRFEDYFKDIEIYRIAEERPRKKLIAEIDCLVAMLYEVDGRTLQKIARSFDKYYSKKEVESWFQLSTTGDAL